MTQPNANPDVAHKWLKAQREEVNGHISTWSDETMDRYHRDLGLLVDFVTDFCPNALLSDLVRAYEREVGPALDWHDTAMTEEEFLIATREYRAAKEWLSANAKCTRCGGTGSVDSGGVTPWESAIMLPCPTCSLNNSTGGK